jgi:hypothetical protein
MPANETETSIRIPVVLCTVDGIPLDISALIAIPAERLKRFEDLAIEVSRVRPHVEANKATPLDFHHTDQIIMRMPNVIKKLTALLEVWSPPPDPE